MKKQSNYKVVSSTVEQGVAFSAQVNQMIDNGYVTTGGIQISEGKMYQALVTEKDDLDLKINLDVKETVDEVMKSWKKEVASLPAEKVKKEKA